MRLNKFDKKPMYIIKLTILLTVMSFMALPASSIAADKKLTDSALEDTAIAIATVTQIDQVSREITLKDEDGGKTTFVAGPEIRNFAQIKRGDQVMAQYFNAFAIALEPEGSGAVGRIDKIIAARAEEGEKPGMAIGQITTATGVVEAIDIQNRTVTFKGVAATLTLEVAEEVDLSKIKTGEKVEAAFVSFYAITLEPAPEVSGTIALKTTAVAVGIGFEWGEGTLTMHNGSTHTFKLKGLSLIDIGVTKIEATGKVYNLVEAGDLEGKYMSGEAGATLFAGGSATAMKNSKGVVIKLKSTQKGLKLTLAPEGLSITEVK